MNRLAAVASLLVSLSVRQGVVAAPPELPYDVAPWPAADALFHRDPRWLGGDDAGSLELGPGRVVWFFGDSFVAPTTPFQRRGSTMVHNSVGLQTGSNPEESTFRGYWRTEQGSPRSFFADDGEDFLWPGGSRLIDGKLVVFFMRARHADNDLHFESRGWGAALVANPLDPPDRWEVRRLAAPANPWRILVGSSSALLQDDRLVAWSVAEDSHDVFLASWPAAAVARGELADPQWWCGEQRGWVPQSELDAPPPPVFQQGQTEFTVHRDDATGGFLQLQFTAFPKSPIGFRTASRLTGPWSPLTPAFSPAEVESSDKRLMCYAAKAHPEQQSADLAVTYCSNTFDFGQLVDDQAVYYPRFLKLTRRERER